MTPAWSSALVSLSFVFGVASPLRAERHSFHEPVPSVADRLRGAASRFANISPAQCRKQLKLSGKLGEAFASSGAQNGIATPLRFVQELDGIKFKVPPRSVNFGVLDCRQALLWIHILPVLKKHQVASIRIDNFYRNRSRINRRGKKSQHAYGLAADIVSITLADGRELDVMDDFLGKRGEAPCGPKAGIHPGRTTKSSQIQEAILMRNLVCELGRMGAFHHILTPNYNRAHENHLHLDLKRDNQWFSIS